jgi:multiple sugar transport system substrate-binding protein
VTEEGAKDLYLKPSMLHTISAKTEHPEAAATLLNFLVNSPQSGEIFGTNRGLPASETALEAAELDPLSQQIADYEASISDRLGDAPPVPIVGAGTLEEKFRQLGTELGFGTITVEDAVSQFFSEMDVVLNQ